MLIRLWIRQINFVFRLFSKEKSASGSPLGLGLGLPKASICLLSLASFPPRGQDPYQATPSADVRLVTKYFYQFLSSIEQTWEIREITNNREGWEVEQMHWAVL